MSYADSKSTTLVKIYYIVCIDKKTSFSGLIAKLKLPDQKLLSSEEKESYRVYRIDISDTLMYIYNLLNQVLFEHHKMFKYKRQTIILLGNASIYGRRGL